MRALSDKRFVSAVRELRGSRAFDAFLDALTEANASAQSSLLHAAPDDLARAQGRAIAWHELLDAIAKAQEVRQNTNR